MQDFGQIAGYVHVNMSGSSVCLRKFNLSKGIICNYRVFLKTVSCRPTCMMLNNIFLFTISIFINLRTSIVCKSYRGWGEGVERIDRSSSEEKVAQNI